MRLLIEKAHDGDTDSYREIFELLHNRIFSYALSHTRRRDDALDITQDTFIDLWKGLEKFTYESEEKFLGFVFIILKRKLAKYYGKYNPGVEIDENELELSYEIEPEDYRHLEHAIENLSKHYQEVMKLRYWSGLSFREIASILNTKETTAKVWHHRAIKELQKLLTPFNIHS